MIYIGNQTACWAATPHEPFDYALSQGFRAFEWFPDKKPGAGWDESDLSGTARRYIRDVAKNAGMRLSVHARWQANPLAPDSAPLLWKDLELARDLGAALLNVHLFHEQGLPAFVEALSPLVESTGQAEVQLAIENTPHHSPEDFNQLFAILRRNSGAIRHVGMCLDLGHANLCGATRNDYIAFLDRLDPEVPIIHLHLHENWGDSDAHLPLFTGPAAKDVAGIREFLARLGSRRFSGSVILEQWPHPPSLLIDARDRLQELWEAAENGRGRGAQTRVNSPPRAVFAARAGTSGQREELEEEKTLPNPPEADPFVAELAAANEKWRSWREKLEFARGLLARSEPALTAEQLIYLAIYLRFLGTGEISCVEDGRHFRPVHHARIAAAIQDRLAALTTPGNTWIVRKFYPWLPSSSPDFRRPEPLTRIRDIAHRSDIGSELKREIKNTLQNKLHRCAGPEDLATSAALLARITAPGSNYPADFVRQFRIFHDELKEFFNARSLDERLEALLPRVEPGVADRIRAFRATGPDGPARDAAGGRLEKLGRLTALRESLLAGGGEMAGSGKQELLLADIGLEDFAFVLLSEVCAVVESAEHLDALTEAGILALRNVALGGVEPCECAALVSELRAWGRISNGQNRDELLRLKATALRCRRLAEEFGARTVELYAGRVGTLGRALGVAPHAIRVFAESDIRGHNIFQLSKLVSLLLREVRSRLGLPAWDVVVTGRATGCVTPLASLGDLDSVVVCSGEARHSRKQPLIVLLERAAGDEEISTNVAGLILAHEIPHLSHLAVRARQAGIVFAACEENHEFGRLQSLAGRNISLIAEAERVAIEVVAEAGARRPDASQVAPRILQARLAFERTWIPLEDATPENSGGKASGVRRLAELSHLPGAGFRVPPGFVIPFGVMEWAIHHSPTLGQEYQRALQTVGRESAVGREGLLKAAHCLRERIQKCELSGDLFSDALLPFAGGARFVVRSSANCEDLEHFAGAGLYESLINITAAGLTPAIRAVWASLWTQRAALSREAAGIPHHQAHMAVLVQELVAPELSFVLHSVNPLNQNPAEAYAEIVVGLGDTLVSAASRGSPYRLICEKKSDKVTTTAFANFSQASWPDPEGGLGSSIVDYTGFGLSCHTEVRTQLGRRFAGIAAFLEKAMRQPQDIEGVVVRGEIFLVQSRPQTGLSSRSS